MTGRFMGLVVIRNVTRTQSIAQDHFLPHPSDILICTPLKVGTTWIKALAFATFNRKDQPCKRSSILSHTPHICVPNLEFNLYGGRKLSDLTVAASPRLLSTHIPSSQLFLASWLSSGCKFVYLCRNPKDTFISSWHFFNKILRDVHYKVSLGDAFDAFLKGIHSAGPLWDHVFGFRMLGNQILIRKGKVGDWVNFLIQDMAQQLDESMEQKLQGSGLSFKA
ncbi:cytosolic sulfotransferase 5-like [Dioscorea cayenensis subsp. rotundata]|uniref:Sulfotransferase n=1 Tax=Dioscorea cayennensis subsp. rotundata TaxID=55577 RepID=A0AB40D3C0_DIOCR|nr:cytosolic sulfotransferase 5-like [Dioscorea cayenensis subsp. rotundata]